MKKVAQIPSGDPIFHLVYNSSNLRFFLCPHGSSLWGCKTAGPQSSARPGIEPGPPEDRQLLYKIAKNVASNPKCQRFFWPPTLTVRSFVTPWDTETYNTSFERSDLWLLSGYTFRGVAVLFRPAILPQSTPTLLHISAIGPYSFSETVCIFYMSD